MENLKEYVCGRVGFLLVISIGTTASFSNSAYVPMWIRHNFFKVKVKMVRKKLRFIDMYTVLKIRLI